MVLIAMSDDLLTVTGGNEKSFTPHTEYTGEITELQTRESEYGLYLDIEIDVDNISLQDTPSYRIPDEVTPNHDLGKLIERFTGERVQPGENYDLATLFSIGTRVAFKTGGEGDGGYVNIDKGTVEHISKSKTDNRKQKRSQSEPSGRENEKL